MIQSFADKTTAAIFIGLEVRRIPREIQQRAAEKLALLNAAHKIDDLRVPPGNRLEKLSGDRAGQWSIRINNQWRVCFIFENGNVYDVEIVDYHEEIDMSIRIEEFATTNFSEVATGQPLRPVKPGDILLHDFMEPLGLSANALATALHVPTNRITGILSASRGISADTALRFAHYFGTTPQFWVNLQSNYELRLAEAKVGHRIREEIETCLPVSA